MQCLTSFALSIPLENTQIIRSKAHNHAHSSGAFFFLVTLMDVTSDRGENLLHRSRIFKAIKTWSALTPARAASTIQTFELAKYTPHLNLN